MYLENNTSWLPLEPIYIIPIHQFFIDLASFEIIITRKWSFYFILILINFIKWLPTWVSLRYRFFLEKAVLSSLLQNTKLIIDWLIDFSFMQSQRGIIVKNFFNYITLTGSLPEL